MKSLTWCLVLISSVLSAALPPRLLLPQQVTRTTDVARKLLLEKLDSIGMSRCRADFERETIDLNRLRFIANQVRFYDADGPEGNLRFSGVVGKPASPDERLHDLARELSADAFVLGYQDGGRYVRTGNVVLNDGYFWQVDPQNGMRRATTDEEKRALLLHEILHIALDRDDDDLNRRALCPLRLLAACPRV